MKIMYYQPKLAADKLLSTLLLRGALALLLLFVLVAINAQGQTQPSAAIAPIHATHVMGFEDVRRNVSGELSIDGEDLRFQRKGTPDARVRLTSIKNVSLVEQDKQVGGVPMTLGKAAVPFAGGRVVSLFSHKKYDDLVLEYLDSSGGLHGVIFRLLKGQGDTLKNALSEHGTDLAGSEGSLVLPSAPYEPNKEGKWSIQVDRVDPGGTALDPCFSDAIYENLVRELKKTKQFKDVFRTGDRIANDVPGLLVLKMIVEKYSPGSETRRAVTTVAGATKLKVHIQLVAHDGRIVLEREVTGNVRFVGDNLRAASNLANNAAKTLKQSTLPAIPGTCARFYGREVYDNSLSQNGHLRAGVLKQIFGSWFTDSIFTSAEHLR